MRQHQFSILVGWHCLLEQMHDHGFESLTKQELDEFEQLWAMSKVEPAGT